MALNYRTCVDNPTCFGRSKCVEAYYGLTRRLYQSGETARSGRICKCGDTMVRTALYEAALVRLTRSGGPLEHTPSLGHGSGQVSRDAKNACSSRTQAGHYPLPYVAGRHRIPPVPCPDGLTPPESTAETLSSWNMEEIPMGTTGAGETEETGAVAQADRAA